MNPCVKCNGEVRLGATRIRVNHKNGVHHYIAHKKAASGCQATQPYSTMMFKPYPKSDADKPWFKMRAEWDAANAVKIVPCMTAREAPTLDRWE